MDILDWIDVGKISAERDENLGSYFYDNGTLASVIANKKSFLLLGRKGAGKTALFRFFTEHPDTFVAPQDKVISVSLDDYSWNVHSLLSQSGTAESLAYRQSWKFILLVEAISEISLRENASRKVRKAQRLLEEIFGSPIPSTLELVKNKILQLSKLKLPKGGIDLEAGGIDNIGVSAGEIEFNHISQDNTLRSALMSNIEGITRYLEASLDDVDPGDGSLFFCFDRVDEAWDATSRNISEKVITGLISAADSLTEKYNGLLRPIVFIREDIFETLPLNDKNKLREDCGSLLRWDKDGLNRMILKRLNYFASAKDIVIDDVDALFDQAVMRQRLKPSAYILKRTMFRPRDFVCFMSKIIAAAKEVSQADLFEDTVEALEKLPVEAIYSAESQYSEWLQRELMDEWSVQLPAFKSYLEAIQNHGQNVFRKSDFTDQLVRAGIQVNSTAELGEHLRFLFNNSIIGFKLGDQNYWRYKCFYGTQGFSDEQLYKVHDGLFKALNLTESRSSPQDQDDSR